MRKAYLTILFLLTISHVKASDVRFYNVNTIYGLSIRDTHSIREDKNGFIWSSSKSGILRITDSDYRIYGLPLTTADAFSIKLVYKNDLLYAYTNNGQIFTYNELYDRFDLVTDIRPIIEINNIVIIQMEVDRDGGLWLVTSAGLYVYRHENLVNVDDEPADIQAISEFDDDYLLVIKEEGIFIHNQKTHERQIVYTYPEGVRYSPNKTYYDKENGRLWIGTMFNGLYSYDVNEKVFSRVLADDFPEQPILAIEANSDSTMLIGIDGKGVWELSRDGQRILNTYMEDIDNPSSLPGNGVYDILCDTNKRIWVATYSGGLSFFDQKTPYVTQVTHQVNNNNSLCNNHINKIIEDSRGNIWFGTNNGISRWNRLTNKWDSFYRNKHGQAQVFLALCEDENGNIWAGTYSSGVYVLDGKTGHELYHFTQGEDDSLLSGRFIFELFKDCEGDIWIGGIYTNIICFRSKSRQFRFYPSQPVRSFLEFSPGKILMACSYGLVLMDKESGDIDVLLDGYLGQDILVLDDNIWLGTSGDGLICYNYTTRDYEVFKTEHGLVSNYISSIIHANGYLWLGTENGLCRFNPNDNTVMTFSSVYSLSDRSYNVNADLRLKNGDLMFGTNNGAILFDPNMIYERKIEGRIFYQDIGISGRSIRETPELIGEVPVDKQSALSLNYYQNNLAMEVIPIGIPSSGIKFSWRLTGMEPEWSQPSNLQTISYTNIPPGKYTLSIKMFDNTLTQLIDERSLDIEIVPPFWGTMWFRLLSFIAIIGIFSFLLKTYINRMRRRYTEDKIRCFANMAHGMRTSLTLISAPVEELTKDQDIGPKSRYYVGLIAEQAGRLSSVATQLLDFQKVDIGKGQLFPVMTDVVSLVSQRKSIFESVAQKKGIKLKFSTSHDSFVTAIDTLKIEKVVDNLISNAIKYSHQDGDVEISLDCDETGWVLEVKDFGLGISEKAQKKLFSEFYRGDNTINSRIAGSGIGLLLVKSYVNMHKGQVTVDSKIDVGSSFRITIPYRRLETAKNKEADTPEERPALMTNESVPGSDTGDQTRKTEDTNGHLLIVEDNIELLQFLRQLLQESYHISVAQNGVEAWDAIQKKMPDLVISDVMMPEMDGFELCKLIKSTFESSHIPVILLTTLSEKAKQLEGFGLGADDYVTKPFDMTLLLSRIKSLIKNREVVREKALKLLRRPNEGEPILTNSLNDKFVKRAVEIVNENIANCQFGKAEFASEMNVSESLLYKKIKSLTDLSPVDFIKNIRLDHAARLLRSGEYMVTEVSELCGFSSAGYFSTVFKKHFGKLPTDMHNDDSKQ